MDLQLEEYLFQAIKQQNNQLILHLLHKGANPNRLLSNGKTCTMEVVSIGNISLLNLFLDKEVCSLSSPTSTSRNNSFKKNKLQKRKLDSDSHSETSTSFANISSKYFQVENVSMSEEINCVTPRNRGYYVFIHDDESSTEESNCNFQKTSVVTPPGELEWDEELAHALLPTKEDDTWSSMYKWYAKILEATGPALVKASNCKYTIDQQDLVKKTALHYAVDFKRADVMKILISAGCKIDVPDETGYTPLHYAILNRFLDGINILLDAGSRINQKTPRKTTSMHLAAYSKDIEIVKRVAEAGAHLDDRDTFERTPLNVAARKGSLDITKYLISQGATINSENSRGSTPLCEAVFRNHTDVVSLLLKSGARVTHAQKLLHHSVLRQNAELVSLLATHSTGGMNLCDEFGNTALLKATKCGFLSIAAILLHHGADIRILNKLSGENVVHTAVSNVNNAKVFEDFLLLFIRYKIDINSCGISIVTPLRKALLQEKYEPAAILIKHGAEVNSIASCQNNLKLVRSGQASSAMTRLLISAGHRQSIPATALTLMELCRLSVRRLAKNMPVYKYVANAPLPRAIKSYLMFEEEVEVVILASARKIISPIGSDNELPRDGSSSDSA